MISCIYCRAIATGCEARAHIMPEAIIQNDKTLPPGAECDACNHSLGKLDKALQERLHVAFYLQLFGVPGKDGRARSRIGCVEGDGQSLRFILSDALAFSFEINGQTIARRVATKPPKEQRFSRALHHVAFNFRAYQSGIDVALDARYDDVRRFVRTPRTAEESRAYGHSCSRSSERPPVEISEIATLSGDVIEIGIFGDSFFVDLLRSDGLDEVAAADSAVTINR